jgi:phosphoglycerate dehydrogenase-like enzyme
MIPRYTLILQKPEVLARQRSHLEVLASRYLPGTDCYFAGKPEDVVTGGVAYDLVVTPQLDWLPDVLARIPRPKRIHLTSSGRDVLDAMDLDLEGITVSTSSGVNAAAIAEYVMGGILLHAKQFHRFRDQQHRKEWQRTWLSELTGARLGLVGLGNIGTRVAARALPFGMAMRGCDVRPVAPEGVEQVYGVDQIGELAAWCDIMVLGVPLSPQTRGLVDAGVLGRMRPGSLLINVSRGPVVDERALVDALRSGIPAGAILDVFDEEPLPPEHPFWTMPQVMVTPHVAGTTQHYMENMFAIIARELQGSSRHGDQPSAEPGRPSGEYPEAPRLANSTPPVTEQAPDTTNQDDPEKDLMPPDEQGASLAAYQEIVGLSRAKR